MEAVVDRFEGDYAVLLFEDTPVMFPKRFLPKGTKEGSWLKLSLDLRKTAEQKEKISNLLKKLENK